MEDDTDTDGVADVEDEDEDGVAIADDNKLTENDAETAAAVTGLFRHRQEEVMEGGEHSEE